jgi:hypothetical protein
MIYVMKYFAKYFEKAVGGGWYFTEIKVGM